jgi:hypothetical protein
MGDMKFVITSAPNDETAANREKAIVDRTKMHLKNLGDTRLIETS